MRGRSFCRWLKNRLAAYAAAGLGLLAAVAPAAAQIANAVPYQFVNGRVIDAGQLMSNYNSIIKNVNANAAHSGVNSDITSLTNLSSISVLGAITSSGTVSASSFVTSGTSSFFGPVNIAATLNVSGVTAITNSFSVTGPVTFGANLGVVGILGVTGTISASSGITTGGTLTGLGNIYGGSAAADTFYNGTNGAIVTAYGAGVRATNTVSARTGISNTVTPINAFNIASVTNPSTGVYAFVFSSALNNGSFQVVASSVATPSVLLPVVTAKSTTGFSVTYYATGGAATNLTTQTSDIIVSGGN